jgi:hypothetical protein
MYKHLKEVFNNSSDSEILLHLKNYLQNLNDSNSDHESRMGVPYTEEVDLFINSHARVCLNNVPFKIKIMLEKENLFVIHRVETKQISELKLKHH